MNLQVLYLVAKNSTTYKEFFDKISKSKIKTIDELDYIIEFISGIIGIDSKEIKSKARCRDLVEYRVVYYYLAKKYTDNSLKRIGGKVNKNHATVLHGLKSTYIPEIDKLIKKIEPLYDQKTKELYLQQFNF
jgi:chromosomal replication initiation ATPase DnaA